MQNLVRSLVAFAISSIFVFSVSIPREGVVNYSYKSSGTNSIKYAATPIEESDFSRKFLSPVVKIILISKSPFGDEPFASATGFSVKYDIINDTSYILTNEHFCVSKDEVAFDYEFVYQDSNNVFSFEQNKFNGSLTVVAQDEGRDLCLLKADTKISPVTFVPEDYKLTAMEKVTLVGAPNGVFPILTETFLSGQFDRTPSMTEGDPLLFLSTTVFQGQSGSPIFNSDGKVMGVVFIGLDDSEEHIPGGLGIPMGDVRTFLKESKI